MKKWVELITGVFLMTLMGSIYSYSVFRENIIEIYDVNIFLSGLPYMTALAFYALSMLLTGKIVKRDNTNLIAVSGLLFISLGFFIASQASSLMVLVVGYGVFAGFGVGMTYTVPIFRLQQTKLKRSGFYTGLILLGFGLSPLVTAFLIRFYLTFGLKTAFLLMSLMFLIASPLGLIYNKGQKIKRIRYSVKWNMSFILIYLLFVLVTSVGLMMIGLSLQVGKLYQFGSRELSIGLSLFALSNGLSRPLFGYLMDKHGFIKSALGSIVLIGIGALIGLLNQGQSIFLYYLSFSLFWFNLGAFLALMPQVIKTYYGIDKYASYYGVLFTSYGVAAIIGHLISGVVMNFVSHTSLLYLIILVVCLIALTVLRALSSILKRINMLENQ